MNPYYGYSGYQPYGSYGFNPNPYYNPFYQGGGNAFLMQALAQQQAQAQGQGQGGGGGTIRGISPLVLAKLGYKLYNAYQGANTASQGASAINSAYQSYAPVSSGLEGLGYGNDIYQGVNSANTGAQAANTGAQVANTGQATGASAAQSGTGWGQTASNIGTALGVANALYTGYQGSQDTQNLGREERGARARQGIERAVAAFYTAGLSEAGIAAMDAIWGKGTGQKLMDKKDNFARSKWGKILAPGYSFAMKPVDKGLGKLAGGATEYTEFRNLKKQKDAGIISEEDFNRLAQGAIKTGTQGRKGIDPYRDYLESLSRGESQGEAARAMEFASRVKSGEDKVADKMLRGMDIANQANVIEGISKATGKNYYKDLNTDQRNLMSQAILDYDRIKDDTYFGAKGAASLNLDDNIKNTLLDISKGRQYKPTSTYDDSQYKVQNPGLGKEEAQARLDLLYGEKPEYQGGKGGRMFGGNLMKKVYEAKQEQAFNKLKEEFMKTPGQGFYFK